MLGMLEKCQGSQRSVSVGYVREVSGFPEKCKCWVC